MSVWVVVIPCMCFVCGIIGFLGGFCYGSENEKDKIKDIMVMQERQWKREHGSRFDD